MNFFTCSFFSRSSFSSSLYASSMYSRFLGDSSMVVSFIAACSPGGVGVVCDGCVVC